MASKWLTCLQPRVPLVERIGSGAKRFLACQGVMDTIDSAMYLRLSCLNIAPLGLPVVPEEYLSVAMSPKPTGALMDEVIVFAFGEKFVPRKQFFFGFCWRWVSYKWKQLACWM